MKTRVLSKSVRRPCVAALSSFVLLLALAGCGHKKKNLIVATVSRDWFNAPVLLAEEEAREANPWIKTFDQKSGLASKNAVEAGHADIGLASPVPLLRDPTAWNNIVILGVYMQSDAVIGAVSTGKSLESMPPPYGIIRGTISEVYFAALDHQLGGQLTRDQSKILDIQPPDAGLQLANHSVNTVVVWEPHLTRAHMKGGPTTQLFVPENIYRVNVALITSRSALQTRRAEILAFRDLVRSASDKIMSAPQQARERVQADLQLEPEVLQRSWDKVDFHFIDDHQSLAEILATEMKALSMAGLLPPSAPNAAEQMLKF